MSAPLANKLFALMALPPLPRLDRVTTYTTMPNMAAYTAQEREWVREAARDERVDSEHEEPQS